MYRKVFAAFFQIDVGKVVTEYTRNVKGRYVFADSKMRYVVSVYSAECVVFKGKRRFVAVCHARALYRNFGKSRGFAKRKYAYPLNVGSKFYFQQAATTVKRVRRYRQFGRIFVPRKDERFHIAAISECRRFYLFYPRGYCNGYDVVKRFKHSLAYRRYAARYLYVAARAFRYPYEFRTPFSAYHIVLYYVVAAFVGKGYVVENSAVRYLTYRKIF